MGACHHINSVTCENCRPYFYNQDPRPYWPPAINPYTYPIGVDDIPLKLKNLSGVLETEPSQQRKPYLLDCPYKVPKR